MKALFEAFLATFLAAGFPGPRALFVATVSVQTGASSMIRSGVDDDASSHKASRVNSGPGRWRSESVVAFARSSSTNSNAQLVFELHHL